MGVLKTIYIVSALLSLLLFVCVCAKCIYVIRERYPFFKFPKTHWADKVVVVLKVALLVIVPLLNLCMAVFIVLEFDDLCDRTISELEKKHNLENR